MMNRTLWTSLTLALILAVIIACSSNDNNNDEDQYADVEVKQEGYHIVDEELTITIWTSLTLALILAVITACSSNDNNNNEDQSADVEVNEESFPIVGEELTMTMIAPGTGSSPNWTELDVLEEYAEKTNINFKYNTPPADDFGTNLNLAFSSGDIEDIIY